MRTDKLTTKFQEALGDAQTMALSNDHAFIEPAHVLLAMLRQDDGPKALLQRAGVNVAGLAAGAEVAMKKLPVVQGPDGSGVQVQVGRDMVSLLQASEKESIRCSMERVTLATLMRISGGCSWPGASRSPT